MVAWLAVHCEPERYGRMLLYSCPRTNISQPMQVGPYLPEPEIAEAMTPGAKPAPRSSGNLVTIPMDGSVR